MPHLGEFTKKKHAALTAQADLHAPKLHASSHENGEDDSIDASQLDKMLVFVPYNGKIADIKEADTNKHTLDLATALGETRKIISIKLQALRITGTGNLKVYPNEGVYSWQGNAALHFIEVDIADGTQRLQYSQTVANDDFDLVCLSYMVEA